MGTEPRDAGRWMRDDQADGRKPTTVPPDRSGTTDKRVGEAQDQQGLVVGGSEGLDGTHGGDPGTGSERRTMGHGWPNAFFDEQGLFSLVAAHARYRQPA